MRLFRKQRASKPTFDAPIAPEDAFYAVGDIHGRDDLLLRLLERLAKDAHPTARLICVGDYVDRGDNSAQVLTRLHRMQSGAGDMMTCLMGNHERMLLDFLDDPVRAGSRWQRYGGLQTLASYRLPPVTETAPERDWLANRDRLRDAMGDELIGWLSDLPLIWQSGNMAVTHAGADPTLAINAQKSRTLLWGHPRFSEMPRTDGIWIVHGHTITRDPRAEEGRIPLDTGAFATDKLTAALIEPGRVEYLTA